MSREAPLASWLHIGPGSMATVTVTFPGTYKGFSLTAAQARRLRQALEAACETIDQDSGDRDRRVSINLMQGI